MKMGGVAAIAGGVCWTVAAWAAALSPPYGTAGNVTNRLLAEDAWMLLALPLLAAGAWALHGDHRLADVRQTLLERHPNLARRPS